MKIWIQFEATNNSFLTAICGGVDRGVYLDGLMVSGEALGYVVEAIDKQGLHPVVRVGAALAMKKLHGGYAIIYGKSRIKTKPDDKTLIVVPDGKIAERANAIEEVLRFFKRHKIKSTL